MENRATNARWWEMKRCEALVVLPELHVWDNGLVGVGEQGFGFVELIERV